MKYSAGTSGVPGPKPGLQRGRRPVSALRELAVMMTDVEEILPRLSIKTCRQPMGAWGISWFRGTGEQGKVFFSLLPPVPLLLW